jgi:glycosyltransferase involved in cell wall biosynthesis
LAARDKSGAVYRRYAGGSALSYRHDICIVGLKCFGLLANYEVPKYLGGIERVLVALARGMAQQGLRVAFITFDEGHPDGDVIDNVTVFNAYREGDGIRGIRAFHPKASSIKMAMQRADARVYLEMGAGIETFWTALFAHFFMGARRLMVYCLASDSDARLDVPLIESGIERLLYKRGLKGADVVLSQTITQKKLLLEQFQLVSTVTPLPYITSASKADVDQVGEDMIWVGRLMKDKRLEYYLQLAARFPKKRFHVIGAANQVSDYAKSVMDQAKTHPNVIVHGRISDDALEALYKNACILFCTSVLEGFPTTFLEAWSYGVPVVTTFDPDNVVSMNKLGGVAQDVESLYQEASKLIDNEDVYEEAAMRCRAYYDAHYTAESAVPGLLAAIGSPTAIQETS